MGWERELRRTLNSTVVAGEGLSNGPDGAERELKQLAEIASKPAGPGRADQARLFLGGGSRMASNNDAWLMQGRQILTLQRVCCSVGKEGGSIGKMCDARWERPMQHGGKSNQQNTRGCPLRPRQYLSAGYGRWVVLQERESSPGSKRPKGRISNSTRTNPLLLERLGGPGRPLGGCDSPKRQ